MRRDLSSAVVLGAKRLSKGESTIMGAISATNLAGGLAAAEESIAVQEMDHALRRQLGCENIP
jgi:hypothetical protein